MVSCDIGIIWCVDISEQRIPDNLRLLQYYCDINYSPCHFVILHYEITKNIRGDTKYIYCMPDYNHINGSIFQCQGSCHIM